LKYEATINFEVKDERVDLTELMAGHKIDIRGMELVGRTDQGDESVWVMASIPAAVEWSDDKKEEMSQATKETSRRLGVDEETVEQLVEWMSYVYDLMTSKGLCADPAYHVIPEALEVMRNRAPG
jgi:hypothetical protein